MHLKRYLEQTGMTPAQFGAQVGLDPSSVYRLLRGGTCSGAAMGRIHAATGGRVTPNDLTSLHGAEGGAGPADPDAPNGAGPAQVAKGRLKRLLGLR